MKCAELELFSDCAGSEVIKIFNFMPIEGRSKGRQSRVMASRSC
jgi:hypothetical protein